MSPYIYSYIANFVDTVAECAVCVDMAYPAGFQNKHTEKHKHGGQRTKLCYINNQ
jgi:hypothetical protein